MFPSASFLRRRLAEILGDKDDQGHDIRGLEEELMALPDSYDALAQFGYSLRDLPLRAD